jgi:hypothetical protein
VARRHIDQTFFDSLCAAFRAASGAFAHVGRLCGCDYRTARRGYEQGWRPQFMPIRDVLAAEKQAAAAPAPAAAPAVTREERESAASERVMVMALQALQLWQKYIHPLAAKSSEILHARATATATIDPAEARANLRDATKYAWHAAQLSRLAIEVDRLRSPAPITIGVELTADASVQDTIREARALLANLEMDMQTHGDDHAGPAAPPLDTAAAPAWPPAQQRQQQSGHMTCLRCDGALVKSGSSHPNPTIERHGCSRCGAHFLLSGGSLFEDLDAATKPIAQA